MTALSHYLLLLYLKNFILQAKLLRRVRRFGFNLRL